MLKPHFLYRKIGVCRGIPIFLIFAQNIDCGYPLEPPRIFLLQNIDCGYSLEPPR